MHVLDHLLAERVAGDITVEGETVDVGKVGDFVEVDEGLSWILRFCLLFDGHDKDENEGEGKENTDEGRRRDGEDRQLKLRNYERGILDGSGHEL